MVPLCAARIEDLGPGDFVKVEYTACSHRELIRAKLTPPRLTATALHSGVGFGTAAALPWV